MCRKGFTLIEVLVAVSLTAIIMGVVYFGLSAALESWRFTKDELALQQVLNSALIRLEEGTDWAPGLVSALEVTRADEDGLDYVIPWTETHTVGDPRGSFELTKYPKSGTGLPVAEYRPPDAQGLRPVQIYWADVDLHGGRPSVKTGMELVSGGTMRFSYHPDPRRVPEAVAAIRWDEEAKTLWREGEDLGDNAFGVVITDCKFRYYDPANALVSEGGDVPDNALPFVTAVGVEMTARLGTHTLTLPGMVMLRNSARQGGLLVLREGLVVPIADSKSIRTFLLTNLTGVDAEDELQLEVIPRRGPSWRVTAYFERYGHVKPVIGRVTIEYPPGRQVFTLNPRTDAGLGINFLSVDPGGAYDYDDDADIEDAVLVEGPARLKVTKMDVEGAGCFVRP